jgi:hypothetical protein
MRPGPLGDDSRPLSEDERVKLAHIERSLMVDEPGLSARLDRGLEPRRSLVRRTVVSATLTAAGVSAMVASVTTGEEVANAFVGVAGFGATCVGVSRLIDDLGFDATRDRARKVLGLVAGRRR